MIDDYMKSLMDSPINSAERANKIFLPHGTKPNAEKTEAEKLSQLAQSRAAREREKVSLRTKRDTLFQYYATTDLPVKRVAELLGCKDVEAIEGLRKFGRNV